jgi:predicted house-cleaning noncanonical NTP pyrophosphatase (MazG superfamily)
MMMKFNKLVRDKVPEEIKKDGRVPKFHIASEGEYWGKLKEKLQEEVGEFLIADNIGELADILEVLEEISKFKKFDKKQIEKIKKKKIEVKGLFSKKIILDEIWE